MRELANDALGKAERDRELGHENIKLREEENAIRKLFLNPANEALKNPYIHLIDVFKNAPTFEINLEKPTIPLFLDQYYTVSKGSAIVNSIEKFEENFYKIAGQQIILPNISDINLGPLKQLDWNNVFVAGGSVLASLMAPPYDSGKHKF